MTVLRRPQHPPDGIGRERAGSWRGASPEGASFAAGAVLCDVETDKTLTEVEAETDGVLAKRLAAEGDELKVGDLIGAPLPRRLRPLRRSRPPCKHAPKIVTASGAAAYSDASPNRPVGPSARGVDSQESRIVRRTGRRIEALRRWRDGLAKEHGIDLASYAVRVPTDVSPAMMC
jgi:pyruvate/2-oxoglutarate dehydrogenase complex dihydrolipoamide acyltransferase (E2) component